MTRILSTLLCSALLVGTLGVAHAQSRTPAPRDRFVLKTIDQAVEAPSSTVTLPSALGGSLVMPPCGGCVPKSFTTTANTGWFVNGEAVTLVKLREVANANPTIALTVLYTVATNEIVQVSAAL